MHMKKQNFTFKWETKTLYSKINLLYGRIFGKLYKSQNVKT